ncbi:hypothetical protein BU24DRAFT_353168 [Aaosphaeria arxii CBS 175.79]|uniref:Hemerythrin-like domain-containing protein n=1 Tax=Aaosphaeria arxii CBS 175.79 TaxID=1450172 RepID=A0A6A5XHY1_9PLEO|nr:uncharacterized protein BU24DRAFT_353168 [Aaosphaeria arxii CBS 175.79]KAF2011924.1 hypothetical protein BU24DRAFT_353168 [Aaosphaeria arxii CBS 175.79]
MASSQGTSPQRPWADGPLKMVQTPMYTTKADDTFTKGASHMALIHNSVLRGYNSIYLQAPHVKPEDYADFIGYCLAWFKLVKSHHDDEEANLFPGIVEMLGKEDKEVWGDTHHEHEAMLPGLVAFNEYLTTLSSPSDFSSAKLLEIMKTFEAPLDHHFHSEISTIASLSRMGSFPNATAVFKTWGRQTLTKAGYAEVFAFVFLNFDRTYEERLWESWPPMPYPIRWALIRYSAWWHQGWWRFASCDIDGYPKDLYALGDAGEAQARI